MVDVDVDVQGRALRERLEAQAADIVAIAADARAVFAAGGRGELVRWLGLELEGYCERGDVAPLHDILGVPPGSWLATEIAAYRTQVGHVWTPGASTPQQLLAHFFVEPLEVVVATAARVRQEGTTGFVDLTFAPTASTPSYPARAEFPADVFARIVLGFRAALDLRLQELAP